ncbi:DUF4268 domain-containing protein [Methanobrevibacter sp.]|uniref:DUF4268 domain-containing protein n=1 Tax=Methanobrevibacter sp. TaxID=66852 RepID=UPI00386476F6
MTSTKMLQYNYWAKVKEEIDNKYPEFRSRKPYAQNFYNLALGSSLAEISLNINTQNSEIKSQIWIGNNKQLFDYLYEFKDEIELELELELNWKRLDNYKASIIEIVKNIDINNESNWDESIKWQLDIASKLYDAFSDRIKNFN